MFKNISLQILKMFLNNLHPDSMVGDYEEEYFYIKRERGAFHALVWLWKEIFHLIPKYFNNSFFWSLVMLKNYLKIAGRIILRQKTYSFINISGLAVGLAACILIMLWVQHELSYDKFHEKSENLYVLYNYEQYNDGEWQYWAHSPAPLLANLKNEFPEFSEIVRTRRHGGTLRYEEKSFNEKRIFYCDSNFLDMFSFKLLEGSRENCLKDPLSIVVSESMAEKYFGRSDPIGKILRLDGRIELTVTGIVEDTPSNSSLEYDFLVPFQTIKEVGYDVESWGSWAHFYYLYIEPSVDKEQLKGKIKEYYQQVFTNPNGSPPYISFMPFEDMYLGSSDILGGWLRGDINYIYIFSAVAFFILLTACINFMNLATAKSAKRAKEVGLRKVVGASRGNVILQFYGESSFVALLALLFSIFIVFVSLPSFNDLTSKELLFKNIFSSQILLVIGATFLVTSLFSGSYPAMYLSSFLPVKVLKGTLESNSGNSLFRKLLVSFQFTLTIGLIISAIIINEQLSYVRNCNMGFDKDQVVRIRLPRNVLNSLEVLRNDIKQISGVENISYSSTYPTGGMSSMSGFDWEGRTGNEEINCFRFSTDENFANTLGLEMVEGRFISNEFADDTLSSVVVNQTFLSVTGMKDPIGKRVARGRIVGVVKDFNFQSFHEPIAPLMIFKSDEYMFAMLKLRKGDVLNTIDKIKELWNERTNHSPFQLSFLDESINEIYKTEEKIEATINVFTFLILFVAALGLFGLSSYTAEQRKKEVGIRKVMGASVIGLFILMVRDYAKWIVLANIVAWPIAYVVMSKWLEDFAYRIDIPYLVFPLAGFLALLIAIISVGYQSISAATSNPIESIKYE